MDREAHAHIISSQVICKQPGRYIGWPTIGRMPDGELLVVFSGDRDAHVCPFGKTFLVRSEDDGQTWSDPELINDTPLDDRDAGICVCVDGTVVVSWFTSHYEEEVYMRWAPPGEESRWRKRIRAVSAGDIRRWAGDTVADGRYALGYWIRRSTDGGHTWEDPLRVPCSAPHGPIALSDGRLLFVGIDGVQGRDEREGSILAAESCDQGRTWSVIGRVNMYPEYGGEDPAGYAYLCEPHVVEVAPRRLLAMARYEERPRPQDGMRSVLWQFTSDDGGRTWTEPRPTEIVGKPPHLIRLQDGRLLVTYGYRHPPYGQRACLSADGGEHWDYDNEIVLRDDAPSGDLGYPASVQLDDGTLLTVYYQQERPGEKTCLMLTHWRLDG
ncbi:MAG: sialidase family protein [Chloroflexota bacterium]|nr:sialidase family protein [Chloroflexota bacterium]